MYLSENLSPVDTPSPAFVREFITPTSEEVVLRVPATMVGQRVEFLAIPSPLEPEEDRLGTGSSAGTNGAAEEEKPRLTVEEILAMTEPYRVDMTGYTFDRDEANDYE